MQKKRKRKDIRFSSCCQVEGDITFTRSSKGTCNARVKSTNHPKIGEEAMPKFKFQETFDRKPFTEQ
jgi:hypothetical protein